MSAYTLPKNYEEYVQHLEEMYTNIMEEKNCTREEAINFYYKGIFEGVFPAEPDGLGNDVLSEELIEFLKQPQKL